MRTRVKLPVLYTVVCPGEAGPEEAIQAVYEAAAGSWRGGTSLAMADGHFVVDFTTVVAGEQLLLERTHCYVTMRDGLTRVTTSVVSALTGWAQITPLLHANICLLLDVPVTVPVAPDTIAPHLAEAESASIRVSSGASAHE